MSRSSCVLLIVASGALSSSACVAAQLADYAFDGNLSSDVGVAPDLVYLGSAESYATVMIDGNSVSVLDFELGSGLRFASGGPMDEYTVAMRIRLDANPSWQKLVDVTDLANDEGMYLFNNFAEYFGATPSPDYNSAWEVSDTEFFQLLLSRRAADGMVRVFIDGVEQFSFEDTGDLALVDTSGNMHFLVDDTQTSMTENPAGQVDRIRIWDVALSDEEIAELNHSSSVSIPFLTQLADYQFNGTLSSDVGTISDLEYLGGTPVFTGGKLEIPAGSGLRLIADEPGEVSKERYTIVMDIILEEQSGVQKLLDFSSLLTQAGLYSDNGFPVFDPDTPNEGLPVIPNGERVQILMTRDSASDRATTYVNGLLRHSFIDSAGRAEINADSEIYFLLDDLTGIADENPAGSIHRLRIWDGALVPSQIDALNPGPLIFVDGFELSEEEN